MNWTAILALIITPIAVIAVFGVIFRIAGGKPDPANESDEDRDWWKAIR